MLLFRSVIKSMWSKDRYTQSVFSGTKTIKEGAQETLLLSNSDPFEDKQF